MGRVTARDLLIAAFAMALAVVGITSAHTRIDVGGAGGAAMTHAQRYQLLERAREARWQRAVVTAVAVREAPPAPVAVVQVATAPGIAPSGACVTTGAAVARPAAPVRLVAC